MEGCRIPLLRAGYYLPRPRNPEPGPGADGPGCQSGTLRSRQTIIRGRVSVPSIHDLDGEEDAAANVLLLKVLLKKVAGTSIAPLRVKTSSE